MLGICSLSQEIHERPRLQCEDNDFGHFLCKDTDTSLCRQSSKLLHKVYGMDNISLNRSMFNEVRTPYVDCDLYVCTICVTILCKHYMTSVNVTFTRPP